MSTTSSPNDTKTNNESISENASNELLPGCWLKTPWNPCTIGSITEQSHLIDLIPLIQIQWIRTFLFWIVLIAVTLGLGIFGPSALMALKLPVPHLIELGRSGLDRWLEGIILFLAAGAAYLSWRIRRQKPECITSGHILLLVSIVFIYMSLDRTGHVANAIIQCINAVLNPPLDDKGSVFWESIVYGTIYLALLSRLLIEFSGATLAQIFLLLATAGYACSCGIWFAPESWKLPLAIPVLSGSLTLVSDFFLLWSVVNYARFILLDGFGLTGRTWRGVMQQYKVWEDNHRQQIADPKHEYPKNFSTQNDPVVNKENSTKATSSLNSDSKNIPVQAYFNSDNTTSQTITGSQNTTNKSETSDVPKVPTPVVAGSQPTQKELSGQGNTENTSNLATNTPSFTTIGSATPTQPVAPTSQIPQQYPQSTPLYLQPQFQQYPQAYSLQPYPPQSYTQPYNSPYGVQIQNGQPGYVQPQPYNQQLYNQPVFSPSCLSQSALQQQISSGNISPQLVQPQSAISQQVASQQPLQPLVQPVTQQDMNSSSQEKEFVNLSSVGLSPLEIQQEFKTLEARLNRPLTHDEKKAVTRRLIKARQGK